MPIHVVVAHLAAFLGPLAALISLVYCWLPRSRRGMRVPLAASTVGALVFATWAELSGTDLWRQLKASLGGTLPAQTVAHKNDAEALVMTVFVFAIIVLAVIWTVVAPERRGTANTIWSVVITLLALAVLVFTWGAVYHAMGSVWLHHSPLR